MIAKNLNAIIGMADSGFPQLSFSANRSAGRYFAGLTNTMYGLGTKLILPHCFTFTARSALQISRPGRCM